jgi:hypothetical protein
MRSILIVNLLLWFSLVIVFAQDADALLGQYHLPNKIDVEIFKKEGKYLGRIIRLNGFEGGQTKDVNNPEKSKQNDLLIGKVIIENLEFDSKNKQWVNGKMYGAEKGLCFDLKINELRDTEIEVVGSKYFFWRTLIWRKI